MTSSGSPEALIRSLDAPTYSIAQTGRLADMPRWTVRRYLKGYRYEVSPERSSEKRFQPGVVEQSRPDIPYASFLDLIDLLFVKEFLRRGFSLQFLRRALKEAKEYLGSRHFARSVFWTSSHDIILQLPVEGHMIALMTGGQHAIPQIVSKLSDKLDFEEITEYGFVRRWYPLGKKGKIVIDPLISFGRPTLIGRGVATSNIYDLYLGENKSMPLTSEWFNIPIPEIKAAVHFEHGLWN